MVEKIAASVPATGASGPGSGADFGKELAQSVSKGGAKGSPIAGQAGKPMQSATRQPAATQAPPEVDARARTAAPGMQAAQPGARTTQTRAAEAARHTRASQVAAPKTTEAAARAQAAIPAERPGGANILNEVQQAQARLDQILKMAESGRTFSPAELLAFQAHTYRASQELEMASKVVEKGTNAVKQTLQTQI